MPPPLGQARPAEEPYQVVTQRLRLAAEVGAFGIWDWDLNTNQVVWDARMFALYGVAPTPSGEVGYHTWADRVHPADLPRMEATLRGVIAQQQQAPLEFRIYWPDGSLHYLSGSEALITDDTGRPVRMVGVNQEVTAQHLAAEERQRLVHDLGERVKELTLIHYTARLLQSQRPFDQALLAELVALIPAAWQYPEICAARIAYGAFEAATPNWQASPWKQTVTFAPERGGGVIEVVYLEEAPASAEGPFLLEERALLGSLAEMLDTHLELRQAADELRQREAEFRAIFEYAGIGMALVDMAGRLVRSNPALEQFLGYTAAELAGLTFAEVTHPEDVETDLHLFRAVLAAERSTYQLEKRYLRRDQQVVWGRLTASLLFQDASRPRYVVGMVEDVTARKAYALQLQALSQASIQINSAGSLPEAINRATAAARSIIGSHQAVTSFTVDANWAQSISATSLSDKYAAFREYAVQPDGSGIYALVCRDNRPQRLTQAELEAHPAWRAFGPEAGRHPPLRGWLAAPLVSRDGRNLGLIQLSDKYAGDFNVDDEAILVQLAQMVSVAAENGRLFAAVQAAQQRQAALARQLVEAQELERRRLAREIHDDVSQSLTAIMLQVGAARRALPTAGAPPAAMLEQTEALTEATLNGVRRLIAGLRPPVLDDLGLLPAVRQLAHELEQRTGLTVGVEAGGLPDRLPTQIETALFRITQEALSNIGKHARARRVTIALRAEHGGVTLEVHDDGVGLPPADPPTQPATGRVVAQAWHVPADHYGLLGIEERAAQLGGTLRLSSAPGQGTRLRVELPLEDKTDGKMEGKLEGNHAGDRPDL